MLKKRMIVNILATYLQTAVSTVLGIFCGRWVFQALGEENYGVFSLVGAIMVFVSFLNSTIVWSTGRFFAFAIGEDRKNNGDNDSLCKWINTAFCVQFFLPLISVLIGLPFGLYCIENYFEIPLRLMSVSKFVFFVSLCSLYQTMFFSPIIALYTAKQYIFVRNFTSIILSIAFAIEGWWLLNFDGDRVKLHAVLLVFFPFIVNVLLLCVGVRQFPELRIRKKYLFDKYRIKQMLSFSVYSMIGALGPLFSNSGIAFVLNRTEGGVMMNAAYGVANHVNSKLNVLTNAITEAVNPEITSRVGAECYDSAETLAIKECFCACGFCCFFVIPILFFAEFIMVLWLDNPPQLASFFLQMMLVNILADRITCGYSTLIHAFGRIKNYTLVLGLANASRCFLVAILYFLFGFGLKMSIILGWVIPFLILNQIRVVYAKKILNISIITYMKKVLFPISLIILLSSFFSFMWRISFNISLYSFVSLLITNTLLVIAVIVLCTSREERNFLFQQFGLLKNKILRK